MNKEIQNNSDEIKKDLSIEAEELLSSELSEVEGGNMGCTNCKLLCYNELI